MTMIGPAVRQLRLKRKLSQEALANTAHVSSGYLSKLERGYYKAPSNEVLSRIAAALSVEIVDLYREAGLEHLLNERNPALEPMIEAFAPKLDDLSKRDRGIIVGELRRIFRLEAEEAD